MPISTKLAMLLAGLSVFSAAHAADNREPFSVRLQAPPVKVAAPNPPGKAMRGVGLRVEDGRGDAAGAVIGHATSDDDVLFPIIASNEVTPFVQDVAQQALSGWGIDGAAAKDGTLRLRYAQFDIDEKNRAVGATYVAEVKLDWTLLNRAGREVSHGSVYGTTDHYGKGRSAENINETLSDALKSAVDGATVLRVERAQLAQWLSPASGRQLADHLYMVDPMGHWMMRFPPTADVAGASSIRKDLQRLMRASAGWDQPGRTGS